MKQVADAALQGMTLDVARALDDPEDGEDGASEGRPVSEASFGEADNLRALGELRLPEAEAFSQVARARAEAANQVSASAARAQLERRGRPITGVVGILLFTERPLPLSR
jgi:hypothetical protein